MEFPPVWRLLFQPAHPAPGELLRLPELELDHAEANASEQSVSACLVFCTSGCGWSPTVRGNRPALADGVWTIQPNMALRNDFCLLGDVGRVAGYIAS